MRPDWRWKRRCAWKAQNAFHFPTATTTNEVTLVPPRSAEERTGRENSQTACRKTWLSEKVFRDREIYQDRHARIIIMARRPLLHQEAGYIYADCPLAQLQPSCSPAADHTLSQTIWARLAR